MNPVDLQRDVRAAISMAYELSRHEQIQQKMHIAAALADLEFELTRIEAKLGGPRVDEIVPASLSVFVAEVSTVVADAGNVVAAQIDALLGSVRGIQRRLAALAAPPRARTAFELALGLGALGVLFFAKSRRTKTAAAVGLGAMGFLLLATRSGTSIRRARRRAIGPRGLRSGATRPALTTGSAALIDHWMLTTNE